MAQQLEPRPLTDEKRHGEIEYNPKDPDTYIYDVKSSSTDEKKSIQLSPSQSEVEVGLITEDIALKTTLDYVTKTLDCSDDPTLNPYTVSSSLPASLIEVFIVAGSCLCVGPRIGCFWSRHCRDLLLQTSNHSGEHYIPADHSIPIWRGNAAYSNIRYDLARYSARSNHFPEQNMEPYRPCTEPWPVQHEGTHLHHDHGFLSGCLRSGY